MTAVAQAATQISQSQVRMTAHQDSNEDHIYAMGKKNTKQSRSVTVETTGAPTAQEAANRLYLGLASKTQARL